MSNKLSMMTKRAEETEQQKAVRRNIDKANKAIKRARESDSTKELHTKTKKLNEHQVSR